LLVFNTLRMPYSLKGRNVLITGGSRGLGALLCEKFAIEGANISVNYLSSKDAAEKVAAKVKNDFGVKSIVIQGDVGVASDCERLVKETIEQLGGIDVIVNNAGWTKPSKFGDLNALSHDEWNKCWAVNTMSQLVLMQAAVDTFNANSEGGVFLISSSIAAISCAGSSMAYSVSKAAQVHLMKCMAKTQGPKIRVNAILPGLLLTDWGLRLSKESQQAAIAGAALKHETYLEDCADAYVACARNTSQTGQEIVVDAGIVIG
jgi:NAD(P)-dependent dehydrogenase (short-subunit alcohol dehydrogenase family)